MTGPDGAGDPRAWVDPAVLAAERECLGLAMRSGEALETVLGELTAEDYIRPAHAAVHQTLMELAVAGEPTGITAVVARLGARAAPSGTAPHAATLLERAGGPVYVLELVEKSSTAASAGHYARIVADAARRRRVAEALDRAARLAANPAADATDVEREARNALDHLAWRSDAIWPEPAPLSARLPPLPVGSLPGAVRRIVEAVAAATQTPPDLAAFAALAVLSAAARGGWEIRVGGGWAEQVCLYLAALADSGTRKSAVVAGVGAPLKALGRDARRADADRHAAAAGRYAVLEARAKSARDRAAKAPTEGEYRDALAEAEELAVEAAASAPPAQFRLLCDDVTPEALGVLMAEQGGVMAVLTAEGGLLGTLAGRYADGVPNLDLVLKAFNGEDADAFRISRASVEIPRPILTLGFVIQPDVIAAATKIPELTRRGLLPRMLYARPASTVGTRGLDAPEVPPEVAAEWAATVGKIFAASRDALAGGDPGVILLDAGARPALDAWRGPAGHEGRLHPDLGDLGEIVEWASKLPGALVRIAALFALAERPGDAHPRVTGAEMSAALDLAPYLISHAREVLTEGGGQRGRLEALLNWIKKAHRDGRDGAAGPGPAAITRSNTRIRSVDDPDSTDTNGIGRPSGDGEWSFSLRDAHRGVGDQSWAKRSADVEEALTHLEDLGYVRRLPPPASRGAGRPSLRYQANPRFLRTVTRPRSR